VDYSASGRAKLFQKIKVMATTKVPISIHTEIYERQARICKAFAHPGRLQILDLLGEGERRVSELQEALGISKTSLSQHLSVLKSAGVLATRREGKQIYCSLAMPEVKQACQLIRRVLQAQIAKIMALPDIKERIATMGFDPTFSTPDELAAHMRAETDKWSKVVRQANLKIE